MRRFMARGIQRARVLAVEGVTAPNAVMELTARMFETPSSCVMVVGIAALTSAGFDIAFTFHSQIHRSISRIPRN